MELMHIVILAVITGTVLVCYIAFRAVVDLFRPKAVQSVSPGVVSDSLETQARRAKAKSLLVGIVNALVGMPIVLLMSTFSADAGTNPFSTALLLVLPIFFIAPFVPQLFYGAGKYQETLTAAKYSLKAPWLLLLAIAVVSFVFELR